MTTHEVARVLGVSTDRLHYLITRMRIPPPSKNPSGEYVWRARDVEFARQALGRVRLGRPPVKGAHYANV